MRAPVFGRDRLPEPWEPTPWPAECAAGSHLVDGALERCTVCGWLDPDVIRCSERDCIYPADYEVEVAAKADPTFSNVLRAAAFCGRHAVLGGIALVPDDGPVA